MQKTFKQVECADIFIKGTMDRILIIEDDNSLRESTAIFLTEEGYNVMEAENGIEGLKLAINNLPNLILCDISMPEMDGFNVYRLLQNHERASMIPFIFITAMSEKEDIRTGMQLGADDYIIKPFDFDELLNSIKVRIEKIKKTRNQGQEVLSMLFDNSLFPVFLIQNGEIIMTNPLFNQLLGYKPQEIISQPVGKILTDDEFSRLNPKLLKCSLGVLRRFNDRCNFIGKDNRCIPVEISAAHINISVYSAGDVLVMAKEAGTPGIQDITSQTFETMVDYVISNKHKLSAGKQGEINLVLNASDKYNHPCTPLTRREQEVLGLICQGHTNQEIGERLFISPRTVEAHRANLLEKTSAANTAELIITAIRNNLVKW